MCLEAFISHKCAVNIILLIVLYFVHSVDNFNIEVNKVGIANGDENSQFGYSVAFIKTPGWKNKNAETFHQKMLLVGSPNKTLYHVLGHGQVSSCSSLVTNNITCSFLNVTDLSNKCKSLMRDGNSNCALDGRLGATIAVNRNFDKVINDNDKLIPMVTVCAPGWKNVFKENANGTYHAYMIGMCLKLRDELIPISCSEKYKDSSSTFDYCWPFWPTQHTTSNGGRPVYTHAQAGMSATFTLDGKLDVISAPGVNDWRGAFRANKESWLIEPKDEINETSYFGYSITAGNFTMAVVAAGVPNYYRKEGHTGKVYLYARHSTEIIEHVQFGITRWCAKRNVINVIERFGSLRDQFGTKFGATLASIDITGDGFDELFVGAPLFSNVTKPEHGLVFVYTTIEGDLCGPIGILTGSTAAFARFGTSIADAGDLNKDQYKDFAIGAPYEGAGVVYIYHGVGADNNIMPDKYVQRIDGESIKPGIKSFGWSIYGNEDIDNNRYSDLVVGAYLSDTVVIFRTRPIVQIDVNMIISPSPIPLKGSACSIDGEQICFEVVVKFSWKPKDTEGNLNSPNNITLWWTLNADTIYQLKENSSRVLFRNTTDYSLKQRIVLNRQTMDGQFYNYKLDVQKYRNKSEPYDAWTKLRMEGRLEIAEYIGKDFNILDPILDDTAKTLFKEDVDFDKKCESLDQCTSDLQLNVMLTLPPDGQLTANETVIYVDDAAEFQMTIVVTNLQDSSYRAGFSSYVGTTFKRLISSNAGVIGASCKNIDILSDTQLNCSADSKLDKNENFITSSTFDISRARLIPDNEMTKMQQTINVTVIAEQANQDVNMNNNKFHRSIDVKLKFNVSILENKELSDQVRYKADESSTNTITLTHQYYFVNLGPSVLPQTYINISIPVAKGYEMIANTRYPTWCSLRSSMIYAETTSTVIETTSTTTSKPPDQVRKKREIKSASDSTPVVDASTQQTNIVNITCGNYECEVIECKLKDLQRNDPKTINITIDIFEKAIAKQKNVREVYYATKAKVTDPFIWYGGKVVPWDKLVDAEKWTKFIVEPQSVLSEVNIWIIIGSVLGAVALLIVVIIVLWKCGFFKRKQHSEVQQWKRQSLYHRKSMRLSVASKKDQQPYTPIENDEQKQ